MSTGTIVEKIGQEAEWFQIRLPNKETAWARNDLVVNVHDQFVTKESANIREGPSTNDKLLTQILAKSATIRSLDGRIFLKGKIL